MEKGKMKWIPVPYFKIDHHWNILSCSKRGAQLFKPTRLFLDLIHIDDHDKANQMLAQSSSAQPIKVNLKLNIHNSFFGLFTCTISWEDEIGHIVCTETNTKTDQLERQLKAEKQLLKTKQSLVKSNQNLLTTTNRLIQRLESTLDDSRNPFS